MHTLLWSVAPTLQQAATNPCLRWRLQDTQGQVWVSLLWGHCSFLLGPGAHKVFFVPSESLFFQSCVSSGSSVVGLIVTSTSAYAIPRSAESRAPAPAVGPCWSMPPLETLKLKGRSGSDSGIPGEPKVLFGPLKHLWQVWGLILNAISPLQPSCWSFSLDVEFPFLVGSFILLSMVV